MDTYISPRVNGNTINKFIGKPVILIAEALGNTPDNKGVVARACDGKEVIIYLPPGERFDRRYCEVYGKVVHPSSGTSQIEGYKITPINDDFDMNVYNQVIELSQNKFSHLFL